ncbi:MAG TPA: hypothetical protein VGD40_12855 [Chryseosolibacter sp.]
MKAFASVAIVLFVSVSAFSQKQLILMKRENVLLRLYPGDEIVFKVKNNPRVWRTYINNLSDTSVVTHRDTIAFHSIERIYFDQQKFHNRLGAYLIAGAIALFAIDQINYSVIQGNEFSVDSGISKACIGGVLVGVPLVLARKKYQKMDYRYRLFTAKKGSPFYLPPRTIGASPYDHP